MTPQLLIAIAVLGVVASKLAKWNLITPFLGGAAATTLCVYLDAEPAASVIAVISIYMIVYMANEDVDPLQLLTWESEMPAKVIGTLRYAKGLILTAFFFLPIPAPPGYLKGAIAVLCISGLLIAARPKYSPISLRGLVLLLTLGLGSLWLTSQFLELSIVGLLAGLAAPKLIEESSVQREPKVTPIDRGLEHPPTPLRIFFGFLLTWITPGLSISAVCSSLVAPGIYRMIGACLVSAAIEGWNLGLILRGGAATKTLLANLLVEPNKLNHTPLLVGADLGYGWCIGIFLVAVLPAIALQVAKKEHRVVEDNSIAVLVVVMLQCLVVSNWSGLVYVAIGAALTIVQRQVLPNAPEVRSLIILLPICLG